ncbi:MAG: MFS transporter [Bacteroidetes bacterium]|nr:MAG: MFS transporter [Bacteroidota bacterium]
MQKEKRRLGFWEIWNMSFGFLGIQFGFALQGGNMSRIFETLGASSDDIPMLWIAAPLTGLLVQPIIGYLSDRTWSPRWGRRRPYFFMGAVLSTIALFFMPYSSALWMAAGFLWILDASINISMEPFRALVADKLPDSQRSYGFVVQTLIIGIGTWIASNLPWFVTKLGAKNEAGPGEIPESVFYAFAIGAAVFILSILYTIITTSEDPPTDIEKFKKQNNESAGLINGVKEIVSHISSMPKIMKQLGIVQFFSWFAFFTMWSFATPSLTGWVFGSPSPSADSLNFEVMNLAYNEAANSVSSYMGMYGLSSMLFALVLTFYTSKFEINRKVIHSLSLAAGGFGFVWMLFLSPENSSDLRWCFALIGISWGSILSMPYAMLSGVIPTEKMGVYMGIFNMFIVIPQIVAALGGINWLYKTFIGVEIINTMVLAGICLFLGSLTSLLIKEKPIVSL